MISICGFLENQKSTILIEKLKTHILTPSSLRLIKHRIGIEKPIFSKENTYNKRIEK